MKKIAIIFIITILLSGCSTTYFKQNKLSTDNNKDKKVITIQTREYRNDLFGFKLEVSNDLYPKDQKTMPNGGDIYFGDPGLGAVNNSWFAMYVSIPRDLNYDLKKLIIGFDRTSKEEKYLGMNVEVTNDNWIYFIKNGYIFRLYGDDKKTKEDIEIFFKTLEFDKNINTPDIKIGETDLFTYQDPIGLNYEKQEFSADIIKAPNSMFYYSKNVEKKLNSTNKIIGYKFYIKNPSDINSFNVFAFPRKIFNYKTKNDFIKDFLCTPKNDTDDSCAFLVRSKNIQFSKDYIFFPFVSYKDFNIIRQDYENIIEDTLKVK